MARSMKEDGSKIHATASEYLLHLTDIVMRENGTETSGKARALSSGIMDLSLRENFLKAKRTEMDASSGLMAATILAILKITCSMVKESTTSLTSRKLILANSLRDRLKVLAVRIGKAERHMKGSSLEGKRMAKV